MFNKEYAHNQYKRNMPENQEEKDVSIKDMYHALAKWIRPDLDENPELARRLNEAKERADKGDPSELIKMYKEFRGEKRKKIDIVT